MNVDGFRPTGIVNDFLQAATVISVHQVIILIGFRQAVIVIGFYQAAVMIGFRANPITRYYSPFIPGKTQKWVSMTSKRTPIFCGYHMQHRAPRLLPSCLQVASKLHPSIQVDDK